MLSAPRAEGTRSLPARLPALLAPPVPPLTSSHLRAPRTQQEPRDGPTGKGHCCPWLCPKTCSTHQEQPARRRALASCGHPKPARDKLFCPVPFYPRSKNSWALFLWVQILSSGNLPTPNAHSRLFQAVKAGLCQAQVLILYLQLLKYYHYLKQKNNASCQNQSYLFLSLSHEGKK